MKKRIPPKPGQESVWDYPRPPRIESVPEHLRVVFGGEVIADSRQAYRILETSHPPTYYISMGDIQMQFLQARADKSSFCEWKGRAVYWDLVVGDQVRKTAAWSYPQPNRSYFELTDHFSFYASKTDACYVGDEKVEAQEGDFYGGWITAKIVGPFKGGAGTWGW